MRVCVCYRGYVCVHVCACACNGGGGVCGRVVLRAFIHDEICLCVRVSIFPPVSMCVCVYSLYVCMVV